MARVFWSTRWSTTHRSAENAFHWRCWRCGVCFSMVLQPWLFMTLSLSLYIYIWYMRYMFKRTPNLKNKNFTGTSWDRWSIIQLYSYNQWSLEVYVFPLWMDWKIREPTIRSTTLTAPMVKRPDGKMNLDLDISWGHTFNPKIIAT